MEELIDNEYNKLLNNNITCSGRCNIINNIIQIKFGEPTLKNYKQNLSIDIKEYLNSLINQAESASIGYDSIEVKKVNEVLSEFPLPEKLVYLNYFIRQLQKSSFENEMRNFQKLKTQTIIKHVTSKKNFYKPLSIWLFLIYFPLYNLITLFITFLAIGFLVALVLLPAPFDFMQWLEFEITYQKLSSNYFVNHILNIFSALVGIESNFKAIPKSSFTMGVYIVSKIIAFIYIVNYLFNKLGEFIKTK